MVGALQKILRQHRARVDRAEYALEVILRGHGFARDDAHQSAQLARAPTRSLEHALRQAGRERGHRAAQQVGGRLFVERRHRELQHRRAERRAPHGDQARALSLSFGERGRALGAQGIGVVDQDQHVAQRAVRGELRAQAGARRDVFDPRERGAGHAQGPRDAPEQRRAPRADSTHDAQLCARLERAHALQQLCRGRVDAHDGPQPDVVGALFAARAEARCATQRAREFVDRGVAIGGAIEHGALGDADQRVQHVAIQARAPALVHYLGQGHAERVHLGAHGERRAVEQLGRRVARREALGLHSAFAKRRRQAQIDEGRATADFDHDVGGLHVAVEQARAMEHRELVGGAHERAERTDARALGHDLFQALAFDQLAHQVRARAARQTPEAHHARHTEAFQTRERDGLAHERGHLALARFFGQHLQGELSRRVTVADRPHFSPAPLTQLSERLVPIR